MTRKKLSRFSCDLCGDYKEMDEDNLPDGWVYTTISLGPRIGLYKADVCGYCISKPISKLISKRID